MHLATQIRSWQQSAICAVLCLAVHGLAFAQTDTSSTPKQSHRSASTAKKHSTSGHATTNRVSAHKGSKNSRNKKSSKKRGQQAIDSTRTREIQTALIREHYMQGDPSGTWDSSTQAAMQKYQADHGWQAKTTPDSRALIKLGLGPSHDHLLNPESAMTSTPTNTDLKTPPKQSPSDNNIPQR